MDDNILFLRSQKFFQQKCKIQRAHARIEDCLFSILVKNWKNSRHELFLEILQNVKIKYINVKSSEIWSKTSKVFPDTILWYCDTYSRRGPVCSIFNFEKWKKNALNYAISRLSRTKKATYEYSNFHLLIQKHLGILRYYHFFLQKNFSEKTDFVWAHARVKICVFSILLKNGKNRSHELSLGIV